MPVKLSGASLVAERRRRGAVVYRALREAGPDGVGWARLAALLGSADVVGTTIIWLRSHGVDVLSRSSLGLRDGSRTTAEFVLREPLPSAFESADDAVAGAVGERMRAERAVLGVVLPLRPARRPKHIVQVGQLPLLSTDE